MNLYDLRQAQADFNTAEITDKRKYRKMDL